MTVQSERPLVFDPLDPAFLQNPYPFYEKFRAAGPVVRMGATQWVVARHAQVSQLLRATQLRSEWPEPFQRMRIGEGAAKDFLLRVLLHREGANHTALRRLLMACMRVTPPDELRGFIARQVDQRFDRALEAGHLEVMEDLALPVPAAVACEMVGIPAADQLKVQAWGIEIIKAFTVFLADSDRPRVNAAIEELRAYLAESLEAPAGKLAAIAGILDEPGRPGTFERGDLVDNIIFLLVSGFTTTVHVIAAVCAALLQHPGVAAELRADRSLVQGAVEEIVRYDAPIQHVSRFAAEAIEIEGQMIRPGRVVHLLLGSANHDTRQFANPGDIDIRREPNPHVSFGAGIHTCLGAGLGRLEAAIVLDRAVGRCGVFEPDGEMIRRPVQVFRTYKCLPARVSAA